MSANLALEGPPGVKWSVWGWPGWDARGRFWFRMEDREKNGLWRWVESGLGLMVCWRGGEWCWVFGATGRGFVSPCGCVVNRGVHVDCRDFDYGTEFWDTFPELVAGLMERAGVARERKVWWDASPGTLHPGA